MFASLFIAVSTLSAIANAAENAYQPLIRLPTALRQPITAIYNDYLYVFGGQNATANTAGGLNTKMWRINLANKFSLVGQTDVTHTLDESQWEMVDVTYPTYGVGKDGIFLCNDQCSATIGQYLYIVNPFNISGSSPAYASNVIYRLDLSSNPPVFASQSEFDFGWAGVRYPCVTAVDDKLYIAYGYFSPSSYSTDISVYDPATNTMTPLTGNTNGVSRAHAGCAGNVGGTNVYFFGGRTSSTTAGYPVVDYYRIAGDSWSNALNDVSNYDWDPTNGANTRGRLRCLTLPHQNKIECAGGARLTATLTNSIIYDVTAESQEYVDLADGVQSYGFENYEFDSSDTYSASVMLIVGGYAGDNGEPTNMTQYAVRYTTITPEPTTDPTPSPTSTTPAPTPVPSQPPTCTGCTQNPSPSPTPAPTGEPTTGPVTVESGKKGVTVILSFVLLFLSILSVMII